MLDVRTLRESDGKVLQAVRLRALADAPAAFSTQLRDAQAWSDAQWQARAAFLAQDPSATGRIAFWDGQACGMVCGLISDTTADMTSFWVAPERRGHGVGVALLGAVKDWAMGQGATVLQAWVAEGNERAAAFYARAGFTDTGTHEPFRPDPAKRITLLALRLL